MTDVDMIWYQYIMGIVFVCERVRRFWGIAFGLGSDLVEFAQC